MRRNRIILFIVALLMLSGTFLLFDKVGGAFSALRETQLAELREEALRLIGSEWMLARRDKTDRGDASLTLVEISTDRVVHFTTWNTGGPWASGSLEVGKRFILGLENGPKREISLAAFIRPIPPQ